MSDPRMNRRKFIAAAGATAAVVATHNLGHAQGTEPGPHVEWRNRKSGMGYRRLGKTNLMVSEIGFNADNLKMPKVN